MNKQKSTLHAINSHLVVALLAILITGILLIFIGLFFGLGLLGIATNTELFQSLVIVVIIFGLILIALGVLESLGIIRKIKQVIDLLFKKGDIGISTVQAALQPTSVGGGLKIIRPTMTPSEGMASSKPTTAPKPIPVKTQLEPKPKQFLKAADKKTDAQVLDITLEEGLQKIIDRYNDPKVSSKFSSWDETLMMSFKDLGKSYLYKINMDQGIELSEGFDEDAAVQVNLDSTIFLKMMTKQINPIKAYSSGSLEVKGKMRNLLKLRKLIF